MADLIDRGAVLAEIGEFQIRFNETGDSHERVAYASAEHCMLVIKAAPAVNRWILCSERLPEDGQRVLICSKSKRFFDVFFRSNAQMPSFDSKIFGKVYVWYCEDVIEWLPMPDAYEPEKEDEA